MSAFLPSVIPKNSCQACYPVTFRVSWFFARSLRQNCITKLGRILVAISIGKQPTRELTAKSAYLALLYSLPMLFLFAYLGRWETGIGAWICIGLVLMVVRTHWDLRKHGSFWGAIAFVTLLQVPLIMLIPWGNRGLTGISLLPIALLDYGFAYGCVKLIEKVIKDRSTEF